jgi:transposase-like protein
MKAEDKTTGKGSYSKKVKSKDREIELEVPRDREGEYEPKIIPKGKRDIFEIEDKIIRLYGLGLSTRDISENIKEVYGFEVSEGTISNIRDGVRIWQSRPLQEKKAVIFLDGMFYNVKEEGVVRKTSVCGLIGIDMHGRKEVLGLYVGASESAKYWVNVLMGLKGRGVKEVVIF